MISLTLPYPLSANRYWRTYMPKGFAAPVTTLSQEAKDYKRKVVLMCRELGVSKPFPGRVQLEIRLYPQRPLDADKRIRKDPANWDDTVRCIDLDNANKVLLDALKGIAIEDDKWVRKIIAERMEPDGEARVEVVITAVSSEQVQGALL